MAKRSIVPPSEQKEICVEVLDVRSGWFADGRRISLWVRTDKDHAMLLLLKPSHAARVVKGMKTSLAAIKPISAKKKSKNKARSRKPAQRSRV